MGIARNTAASMARRATPSMTSGLVRDILERAIDGMGPVRPAAKAAEATLVAQDGDVEAAVQALIRKHTRLSGAQGFVTNVGGLMTLAVSMPANVAGLALLQCHLVAGIAHLRGYDLSDPRVRNAVLVCLLGPDGVRSLLRKKRIPSSPMGLATSPVHDPEVDAIIGTAVTTELVSRVGGRRVVLMVGRRVPFLGGGIGGVSDALATRHVGRYAAEELRSRHGRTGSD